MLKRGYLDYVFEIRVDPGCGKLENVRRHKYVFHDTKFCVTPRNVSWKGQFTDYDQNVKPYRVLTTVPNHREINIDQWMTIFRAEQKKQQRRAAFKNLIPDDSKDNLDLTDFWERVKQREALSPNFVPESDDESMCVPESDDEPME